MDTSPGSSECLDSRIHSTSMGAPMFSTVRPERSRTVEFRPSAPTTNSARTSSSPVGDLARTPATRPASSISPVTSVCILRRDVGHIAHHDFLVPYPRADLADLLMRPLQKLLKQTELVHRFERRGMDGVAAEVAQEVSMLLENQDLDPGPREEEAEHHASRATACDTTADL